MLGNERKGLSPKQKAKRQMTWLQAQCRSAPYTCLITVFPVLLESLMSGELLSNQ